MIFQKRRALLVETALDPESRVTETAILAMWHMGHKVAVLFVREIVAKFLPERTPCPRFDKQNSSHVADCRVRHESGSY